MSSIFIKNVNIINPFSEEPLEERHVLIENGRIKSLHTEESSKWISQRGYHERSSFILLLQCSFQYEGNN